VGVRLFVATGTGVTLARGPFPVSVMGKAEGDGDNFEGEQAPSNVNIMSKKESLFLPIDPLSLNRI
jgi:hypothetical protein